MEEEKRDKTEGVENMVNARQARVGARVVTMSVDS